MKSFISACVFCLCTLSLSAQVQRYDRLCTDGDDYSTAFRVTKNGMEVWLNTSFKMKNKESRRLVRVQCNGGNISAADVLPSPINQEERDGYHRYLDGSPTFPYCDTSYGIFASNRLNNGVNADNDLYEMKNVNGTWQVRRMDELNSDGWDDSPTLSKDGNLLYFASSRGRYKGSGLTDIYVSRRTERGWETPQLVADICTDAAREEAPFLGSDGYLYFSTDREGDMDIYRIKVDAVTGNVVPPEMPVSFEGVNKKGSDEGVPTLSAGGAWLLFSSNRKAEGNGKKDYDIYMVRVHEGSDSIALKVELRTQFFNKVFEDYEDQTLPCTTEVVARDRVTGDVKKFPLSKTGTTSIVFPRTNISEPCMDYRYRQIVLSATPPEIQGKKFVSENDTIVFDVMSSASLSHNFYLWDQAMPEAKGCVQNFRVAEVQFFMTCYWCPTTLKYPGFAQCQSVFRDTSCSKVYVERPKVPCENGDIYSYKLNFEDPTISVIRNPGLCIPASEMNDEQGKLAWSVKVDSAIDKFVTDMRSALQRPCVQRAIRRGDVVDVSVIGWTDPRGIDPSCLYTGPKIDFNHTWVELKDLAKKGKYMPGGVLKTNTSFAKSNSGSGGNELLSDLRAYYTASMLDSIWTQQVDEYRYLKTKRNAQIHIVAVGSAIKRELKDAHSQVNDYALRRAVNVVVSTPGDSITGSGHNEISGRVISLTGPPCEMLLDRPIQAPMQIDDHRSQGQIQVIPSANGASPNNAPKVSDAVRSGTTSATPKPLLNAAKEHALGTAPAQRSERCRVVLYKQCADDAEAATLVDQLKRSGIEATTKSYFDLAKRRSVRVLSKCYDNDDELNTSLLQSKDLAAKSGLAIKPQILLSPDQITDEGASSAAWIVVVKSYVAQDKQHFVDRIEDYLHNRDKYSFDEKQSQHLDKAEKWLAPSSTIWYFSEETKQKALDLARELTTITGISFALQRGTGGVTESVQSRTLTVHVVLP